MSTTAYNQTEIEKRIKTGEEILNEVDEINLPLLREPAQNWYEEILEFLKDYETDEDVKQEAIDAVTAGANYQSQGVFGDSLLKAYVPLESSGAGELDEFQEKIRRIIAALEALPLY